MYLYKLIGANYKNLKEKGNDFLSELLSLEIGTSNTDIFFEKYQRQGVSMNYKNRSEHLYFDKFIQRIFEKYLHSNEQQLLRLLCKLQYDINDYSIIDVLPYLGGETIIKSLQQAGWLQDNTLNTPDVICASLNRSKYYDNEDYSYILNLITDFSNTLRGLNIVQFYFSITFY